MRRPIALPIDLPPVWESIVTPIPPYGVVFRVSSRFFACFPIRYAQIDFPRFSFWFSPLVSPFGFPLFPLFPGFSPLFIFSFIFPVFAFLLRFCFVF
jgi:hypothetical protein